MKIRVGHLYPDYLNIYADRGNMAVLSSRAAWRGLDLEVTPIGIGEQPRPGEHDLLYVGGGQDREQALIAPDVRKEGRLPRASIERGVAVLAVCGGYQLLGRFYRDRYGSELPGAGVLPLHTVAGDRRMIGDVLLECELEPGERRTVAGFENHAGRTILDEGAEPLGRVLAGFGNDGTSGYEGCRRRPRDRHVPPRAAPAPEPVARRLAARAGRRARRPAASAPCSSRSTTRSRPRRMRYPPRAPGHAAARSDGKAVGYGRPERARGRPSGRRAASGRGTAGSADGGRPRRARRARRAGGRGPLRRRR